MPSKRKQINVRLSDDGLARMYRLVERMRRETGMPLSQSDIVQAGLLELEKKYPPSAGEIAKSVEAVKNGDAGHDGGEEATDQASDDQAPAVPKRGASGKRKKRTK